MDAQRKYQRKAPLLPKRGARPGDQSPWTPNYVGRGRACLKNRQDTFFNDTPTCSRLTAPPIKIAEVGIFTRLIPSYGWFVGRGLDPSLPPCGYCNNQKPPPRRGGACPARDITATRTLRVNRPKGFPLWGKLSPQVTDEGGLIGNLSPHPARRRATFSPKGEGLSALLHIVKMCPRGGHTQFIIFYLLS